MRKCHCSGQCGPPSPDPSRREFIGLMGAATAAMFVPGAAWGAFELPPGDLKKWQRGLAEKGAPRRYASNLHTDARLHLGGIGTGNFEIGVDGQFTTWQLFNTLRDGEVPFYFTVKAGAAARLLQTAGGPDWPRVKRIEMTGEYPAAELKFEDDALPVRVELSACTPFAPLDAEFSSMPVAMFRFRLHNPTAETQKVALAAWMTNPIGYEARGGFQGASHPEVGRNITEIFRASDATGLLMSARAGQEPTVDRPVTLRVSKTLQELKLPPHDHPPDFKIELADDAQPLEKDAVIWLDEPAHALTAQFLRRAGDAVRAGATLIFSGSDASLLRDHAAAPGAARRPDIRFEDFESGYEKWTVSGDAFGKEPAHGTLSNQQPVTGFLGHGLVNSFLQGDDATGKLISQPFTIERNFIRFLVGGGKQKTTQIRLVIDGANVRTASGRDVELLEPHSWDVREFVGKTARLEIVDEQKGGWGHINVDEIVFCDWPGDSSVLAAWQELLPRGFAGAAEKTNGGLPMWRQKTGQGQVALVEGTILPMADARAGAARQRAYREVCGIAGIRYEAPDGPLATAPGFGTVALATTGPNVTTRRRFEDWSEAWRAFALEGAFRETVADDSPTEAGKTTHGALASSLELAPQATAEIEFFLTWHFPNKYNDQTGQWIGCHYTTRWPNAQAVMREAAQRREEWRDKTEKFRGALYGSSLPYWLNDCLTANAAIARHIGVVFQPANGDIYGWEGSNGCCDPTCTHVWGYEQALARLFPALERDMRRIDFKHQQRADGGVNNRTEFPSPPHPTGEHPFADGHASCILKAYREALNSPDETFFQEYWPHVKHAVEYLIARDAQSGGGAAQGILQDDQWNTYDEALHGVTSFISGYYLAALRAGEEWARRLHDTATAERFHQIFLAGQKKLLELCWNGEYFQQHLPDYAQREGEIGPGCLANQLIGQWWAHQLNLGYILPPENVKTALQSVFKYNFKSDLTGWKHAPRAFAGAKDKGLIICTWPKGGRPANVMLYSDEVWTGIEYQVAAHMIYEGMLEEGLSVAKAARDRYDGIPRAPLGRNPWCEIECGGHYARAMSSWSLLLAASGFHCDGPRGAWRFAPRLLDDEFKSFFCGPEGWGSFAQNARGATIRVVAGRMRLQTLELNLPLGGGTTVTVAGRPQTVTAAQGALHFGAAPVILAEGEEMRIGII
ncbi:MAG TPA: GH116 family glycosyl-hydrolase [Verrucomicrobiae bacterium]|nr:GH116 family glycosyl-hydrolase [Verrucomicrobiae bacterium]